MLDLNVLKSVREIVCHGNCSDGTMSAILLHDALPDARVRFCNYGLAQEQLEAKPNMLFCDFSPPADGYQRFVDAGAIVLDHHKSAASIVAAFGDRGVFADERRCPGVSGAVLAYLYAWRPLKQDLWARQSWMRRWWDRKEQAVQLRRAKAFSGLVGIRDTWQTHSSAWSKACALSETLRFFGEESWLVSEPFGSARTVWWGTRLTAGLRVVERHTETVKRRVAAAYRFTTADGLRVLMFSGVPYTSDACELAKDSADLVVGFDFGDMEGGMVPVIFSTRARGNFDCARFCKECGGGGHSSAAGFSLRFDPAFGTEDPYRLFRERLAAYEALYGPCKYAVK